MMKRNLSASRYMLVAAASASLGFTVCDASKAQAQGGKAEALDEIVVTAQKRSENLQRAPLSVQVVTAEQLFAKNQTTLVSLSQTTPGVNIRTFAPGAVIIIRGIGSGANASFDQSSAMFSDDVYHGRSRMSQTAFLDLEHVEILKGPQTTYFGNNSISGALNIITKKPDTDAWHGWVRGLYGTHENYALEGAVGGPINDKLAVRVAGTFNGSGGWMTNVIDGKKIPRSENYAGRLTLLYRPNADFDATLKVEGGETDTKVSLFDTPSQLVTCPPLFGSTTGYCAQAIALGRPIGLNSNDAAMLPGSGQHLSAEEYVLTANYGHWDNTFTSVTAFSTYDTQKNYDASAIGASTFTSQLPEKYDQFSQELRVASPAGNMFEYIGGVYFQNDHLHYEQNSDYFFRGTSFTGLPTGHIFSDSQSEQSYSVFASLGWNVTHALKITGGIRGSWVDKQLRFNSLYGYITQQFGGIVPYAGNLCTLTSSATGLQASLAAPFGFTSCSFNLSRSDKAWTPSARIEYRVTPDVMVYGRYDKGFKAGGFNGTDASANPGLMSFQPERVNSYEVGVKSTWFNNTVRFNIDAFWSRYSNLQVSSFTVLPTGVTLTNVNNAGSAVTKGVELETEWAPTEHFHFSANVAYTEAHYLSYPSGPKSIVQSFCLANPANALCLSRYPGGYSSFGNLSGYRLSPKWQGSLTASYSFDLPHELRLITELTPNMSSSYYQDILDNWSGGYVRIDARITLESENKGWAVDFIVKNLTDATIVAAQGMIGQAPNAGFVDYANKLETRNFAVQLRYKW